VMCDATRPSASRRLPEKVPCAYGSCTSTSPSNEIFDERHPQPRLPIARLDAPSLGDQQRAQRESAALEVEAETGSE
jgi:hypothetical protein